MEVLDIANDFTGPLIDDTFPDPERLVEYDNGIKHSGRHRFRHLTAALVLFCAGILTVGFLSCGRMATTHVADGSLTFRPFSDVKAPFDEWTRDDFLQEYEAFRHLHHRGPGRFDTFVSNLRLIDAHNRRPDVRYTLSPNQFTDLTVQEWSREYLDSSPRYEDDVLAERDGSRTLWNLASASNATLPASINWIEKGCVTPVKDQSHCGSCWAFSSTGAIEGALCAQTGTLLNLSEQQLMDCSTDEGTHGCNGGFMDNAFRYVMKDGGLCSESEYPYQAKQGECHTQTCRRLATIEDIYDVPPRNPKAMKAAIVLHGPVAAAVEADKTSFQFYHHGILDLDCGKKLNHAILVVGYGTALNPMTQMNETYWLVKNSWGPSWGDEGYIRLGMKHHGKAGECGVLLAPTVPIVSQKDILS